MAALGNNWGIKRPTVGISNLLFKTVQQHTHTHTHSSTRAQTHNTHVYTQQLTMAIMFDMPKSPSSQLKTVLRYFDLVKVLDLAEIDKLFADDFVQSTRPLSLGVPSRTKEEDLAFLRGFAEKLEERRLEVRKKMGPLVILSKTGLTDD